MKRSILMISGVIVLALLLASAAYVGTRMLRASGGTITGAGGGETGRFMEVIADDGRGPVSLRIKIDPAPELPDRPAEASGIFVRRQDNSVFVGTGAIELDVEIQVKDGKEERTATAHHSGPEVEVVVTRNTVIYRDETDISVEPVGSRESGEKTIQQVVKPVDSLDEVGENTELQVWGERRGDRIVSEVLAYRSLNE